jgi:hypothetical protein
VRIGVEHTPGVKKKSQKKENHIRSDFFDLVH